MGLEEAIAALERENRIIKRKLVRSETNRALLEEAHESHMEVLKMFGENGEDRDVAARLRSENEQELRAKAKTAERLSRLDRLNLIGETAASIGHEVRNPLTTVRGYLQYFENKTSFEQYKDAIWTMIGELDRANAIITGFLSLAKNKRVDMRPGNLKTALLAIKPRLEADAARLGHSLDFYLQGTPGILMDEGEIGQLAENLVRNGLEAMDGPGLVAVSTCRQGGAVLLTVKDTGKGIPQEIIDNIGTPFFSTNKKGSGLGLAIACRIVERHRGAIDFATSPAGTTVTVSFPAYIPLM
jgi:two-component system, sporulation sensor kinase E